MISDTEIRTYSLQHTHGYYSDMLYLYSKDSDNYAIFVRVQKPSGSWIDPVVAQKSFVKDAKLIWGG